MQKLFSSYLVSRFWPFLLVIGIGVYLVSGGEDEETSRPEDQSTPCNETSTGGVLNFCVWTDPDDLKKIQDRPQKRIEIDAEITFEGTRYIGGEFETHGGIKSRGYPKKNYRLKFPKGHLRQDIFDDEAEKHRRLVFLGSWVDPSYLRHKLTMDLIREAGGLAPRVNFARLYLNGSLEGFYTVVERIDDQYLKKQSLSEDGHLFKAESHEANWALSSNVHNGFSLKNDTPKRAEGLKYLLRTLHGTPRNHAAFEQNVAPLLSIEDVHIWHAVMTFAQNTDSFTKNYYLFHDPDAAPGSTEDQVRLIHWDADATFGNSWNGLVFDNTGHDDILGTHNGNLMSPILYGIETYRQEYVDFFLGLLNDTLSVSRLHGIIDRLAQQIGDDARADLLRWNHPGSFDEHIENIKKVVRTRHKVLTEALLIEKGRLITRGVELPPDYKKPVQARGN